jgi:mRNA-degrading endonuclease YafQ of YafQ-DinJ toxin-antitoxin module
MWRVERLDKFNSDLLSIEPNKAYAEELVSGVIWVLLRDPKCGLNAPLSGMWYIISKDVPNQRDLIIFYTFSESQKLVLLLSVSKSSMA